MSRLALDQIPSHRISGRSPGDREPQPGCWALVGSNKNRKIASVHLATLVEYTLEILRPGQSTQTAHGRAGPRSGGQAHASLFASGLEYRPALTGRHPGTEAVRPLAMEIAGLKGSFHAEIPDKPGPGVAGIPRENKRRAFYVGWMKNSTRPLKPWERPRRVPIIYGQALASWRSVPHRPLPRSDPAHVTRSARPPGLVSAPVGNAVPTC